MKKQAQPAHRAKHHRLPQLVRRLIAVLLAAALALTVWTYRAALTPTNIKAWVQENLLGNVGGGGYPVGFSGSADPGNFSVSGDAPALVTDMMFVHLSTRGKMLFAAGSGRENLPHQHRRRAVQRKYGIPVHAVRRGGCAKRIVCAGQHVHRLYVPGDGVRWCRADPV